MGPGDQRVGVVPRLLQWDAARMRRRAEELLAMLAPLGPEADALRAIDPRPVDMLSVSTPPTAAGPGHGWRTSPGASR